MPTPSTVESTVQEVQQIISQGNQTEENLEAVSMSLSKVVEVVQDTTVNFTVNRTVSLLQNYTNLLTFCLYYS